MPVFYTATLGTLIAFGLFICTELAHHTIDDLRNASPFRNPNLTEAFVTRLHSLVWVGCFTLLGLVVLLTTTLPR